MYKIKFNSVCLYSTNPQQMSPRGTLQIPIYLSYQSVQEAQLTIQNSLTFFYPQKAHVIKNIIIMAHFIQLIKW